MNGLLITETRGGQPLHLPEYSRDTLTWGLTLDPDEGVPLVNAYDVARGLNIWTITHRRDVAATAIFIENLPRYVVDEIFVSIPSHMAAALAPLLWDWLERPTLYAGTFAVRRAADGHITWSAMSV